MGRVILYFLRETRFFERISRLVISLEVVLEDFMWSRILNVTDQSARCNAQADAVSESATQIKPVFAIQTSECNEAGRFWPFATWYAQNSNRNKPTCVLILLGKPIYRVPAF